MGYTYAAVDLGASSGRLILARLENGVIKTQEIHRFEDKSSLKGVTLCWDIDYIYDNIIIALKKCASLGMIPDYLGIDSWGVDFALVDENGDLIGDLVSYRDKRTEGVSEKLDFNLLYSVSGIQKLSFNTVYQLVALSSCDADAKKRACKFMMVPDYLGYKLTGICECEYTNASTTALLDAEKREWSEALISLTGFDKKIFSKPVMPSTVLGSLKESVAREIGYNLTVVHVASHDTASAIMAMPYTDDDTVYISSGTWSLMGVEIDTPNLSENSREHNFTNEGGYLGKIRYLKNIMGLWMIQSVKRLLKDKSYEELADMARSCADVGIIIDVNKDRFLAPDNMIEEIKSECGRDLTNEEVLWVIYHSLAKYYAKTVAEIEEICGKCYNSICILGGGSRDELLNSLTEKYSGKKVVKGLMESTATGNVIAQMLYTKEFSSLDEARKTISEMIKTEE